MSTLILKKIDTEYEACVGPYRNLNCRSYSLFFDSFDSCSNAADWIGADKLQYGSSSLDGKAGDLCARVAYTEIPSRQRQFVSLAGIDSAKLRVEPFDDDKLIY